MCFRDMLWHMCGNGQLGRVGSSTLASSLGYQAWQQMSLPAETSISTASSWLKRHSVHNRKADELLRNNSFSWAWWELLRRLIQEGGKFKASLGNLDLVSKRKKLKRKKSAEDSSVLEPFLSVSKAPLNLQYWKLKLTGYCTELSPQQKAEASELSKTCFFIGTQNPRLSQRTVYL